MFQHAYGLDHDSLPRKSAALLQGQPRHLNSFKAVPCPCNCHVSRQLDKRAKAASRVNLAHSRVFNFIIHSAADLA